MLDDLLALFLRACTAALHQGCLRTAMPSHCRSGGVIHSDDSLDTIMETRTYPHAGLSSRRKTEHARMVRRVCAVMLSLCHSGDLVPSDELLDASMHAIYDGITALDAAKAKLADVGIHVHPFTGKHHSNLLLRLL